MSSPAAIMRSMPSVSAIIRNGGNPIAVGGSVRDHLMGKEPKDIDIEVYGLDVQGIINALRPFSPKVVGASFGVIKADDPILGEVDFTVPRRESKIGKGHTGFLVETDPNMSFKDAASRRDFTINAIGMDIDGKIIDPFGGLDDMKNSVIRHVGPQFAEDPLRILRACRFAARFNFAIHQETLRLCRDIRKSLQELPAERVFGELSRLLLEQHPITGLIYLMQSGAMEQILPEVAALAGIEQDAVWHPEGDALKHTMLVTHAAGPICDKRNINGDDKLAVVMAALLHDIGKASNTRIVDGRIKSPDHEAVSANMAAPIMERLKAPKRLTNQVIGLVALHMAFDRNNDPSLKAVRRLALKLKSYGLSMNMWAAIVEADHAGRHPKPPRNPVVRYEEIHANDEISDAPILMGRHLIDIGLKPGPIFKKILDEVYTLQIQGDVNNLDQAINAARRLARRMR